MKQHTISFEKCKLKSQGDTAAHTLEWLTWEVGSREGQSELSYFAVGAWNGASCCAVFARLWLKYLPKRNGNNMCKNVYSSFICNSPELEPSCMTISGMDRQTVVHLFSEILLSNTKGTSSWYMQQHRCISKKTYTEEKKPDLPTPQTLYV